MVKRTYQPKKIPALRKLGFRKRMKSRSGRAIIKRRRRKGRKSLTASDKFRKAGKNTKSKKH